MNRIHKVFMCNCAFNLAVTIVTNQFKTEICLPNDVNLTMRSDSRAHRTEFNWHFVAGKINSNFVAFTVFNSMTQFVAAPLAGEFCIDASVHNKFRIEYRSQHIKSQENVFIKSHLVAFQ